MIKRRGFLQKTASITTAAMFSPLIMPGLRAGVSQNDKITVALIGCNGMGWYNLTII